MATKIDICNMALSFNNEEQIVDITTLETTNDLNARLCRLWFDHCKKLVLRLYPWNSATKKATLSPNTATPIFGEYGISYNLPADFIFLQKLNELDIANDPQIFYKVEGSALLTNETTANVDYTANVETGQLDDLCADVMAYILGSKISFAIRGNADRERELFELGMGLVLPMARSIDTKQKFETQPSRTKGSRRNASRRHGPNG